MLDINLLRKDLASAVARLETRKSPQAFLNVDAFTALCDAHDVREVVLVAPPRALATIRKIASKSLHDRVIGEIDKDLTKHPVHEIEKIVKG